MAESGKIVRDEAIAWINGELSNEEYFDKVYTRERARAQQELDRRLAMLPTLLDDIKLLGRRIVGVFQK
jgi:hypothetical protein